MPAVISDRITKYKLETQTQIGITNTNLTYKYKDETQTPDMEKLNFKYTNTITKLYAMPALI